MIDENDIRAFANAAGGISFLGRFLILEKDCVGGGIAQADRVDVRHIISARGANKKERKLWHSFAKRWNNRTKIESTTEDDIRRHMIEDGQDPAGQLEGFAPVIPPHAG